VHAPGRSLVQPGRQITQAAWHTGVTSPPEAAEVMTAEHLAVFVKDEPGALVFPGAKGRALRRSNFNKFGLAAGDHVHKAEGVHVHD